MLIDNPRRGYPEEDVCDTTKMEWLPISGHESYRMDYDDIRGMILEFWTEN